MDPRRSISNILAWSNEEIAKGIMEVLGRCYALEASNEELRHRVAELESCGKTSQPPSSSIDIKTRNGDRIRGQWWVAIVLALAVLMFAAIWRVEELSAAIRGR